MIRSVRRPTATILPSQHATTGPSAEAWNGGAGTWSPPAATPEHGTTAGHETDAPLTILHVVAPGKFGGLERVVQSLCFGLRRNGHRVHLAVVAPEPEAATQLLAPLATPAPPAGPTACVTES